MEIFYRVFAPRIRELNAEDYIEPDEEEESEL